MNNIINMKNQKKYREQVRKRTSFNNTLEKIIKMLHNETEHRPAWNLLQNIQDVRVDNLEAIKFYKMKIKEERGYND